MWSSQSIPLKEVYANEGAENNANDHISVIIHGQQHDPIRHGELRGTYQGADRLLSDIWPKRRRGRDVVVAIILGNQRVARPGVEGRIAVGLLTDLLDEALVVELGEPGERLEGNGHEDDANAQRCKAAARSYPPRRREETGIYGIPIPEHLLKCQSSNRSTLTRCGQVMLF